MCPAGLDAVVRGLGRAFLFLSVCLSVCLGLLYVYTRCTRHAHAMHTPCTGHAHAMHMQRTCHAHAIHAPCTRLDVGCLLVRLHVYIVLT